MLNPAGSSGASLQIMAVMFIQDHTKPIKEQAKA